LISNGYKYLTKGATGVAGKTELSDAKRLSAIDFVAFNFSLPLGRCVNADSPFFGSALFGV